MLLTLSDSTHEQGCLAMAHGKLWMEQGLNDHKIQ